MSWTEPVPSSSEAPDAVLTRLTSICTDRGLDSLGARLAELGALVGEDMASLEGALGAIHTEQNVVTASGMHLLHLGGKRLRPLCVMLASRVGGGFDERARDLAVAVELVHAATLLHDDVVDVGDQRRGKPAARTLYGNAASIFAGDWLLIEALRLVRGARVEGTLDRLLGIIEEMIFAEAIQLERRGTLELSRDAWLRVVEGKTAALFRWAMFAGARAGGLAEAESRALEGYGQDLGVAFQAVDDLLDLTGDAIVTGKALFTDVREGKLTYPLLVALEREPSLRGALEQIAASEPGAEDPAATQRLLAGLEATGAVNECMALARRRSDSAVARLDELPDGAAKQALATLAVAAVDRRQ